MNNYNLAMQAQYSLVLDAACAASYTTRPEYILDLVLSTVLPGISFSMDGHN